MTEKSTVPVLEGALPVMQISRFGNQHIYGDNKKIYFRVTLVKIALFARAGVTGKMPVKSGWSSFLAIS
jgi:hypothetical protein